MFTMPNTVPTIYLLLQASTESSSKEASSLLCLGTGTPTKVRLLEHDSVSVILPFAVDHLTVPKIENVLRNNRKRDFCQKHKNSLILQRFAHCTF